MQKILIVIPSLNNSGGTERAAINLANMLVSNYAVTILCLTEQKTELLFEVEPKVKIIYNHMPQHNYRILGKVKWLAQCYLGIDKVIRKHKINFIIGLTHNINSVIALLRRQNVKSIGCEHVDYTTIPSISRILINKVYPKLDVLVVLSPQAYDTVKHLNNNIVVIPNSIPFEVQHESSLDHHRILMVGRLSKEKGIKRIVPLAKHLMNKYPSWYIDIFGDGDLKIEIENIIDENILHNVRLNSPVQDIKTEYLNSSIFLSTSYTEALPMSFIEAMQCGVPVISYKHPGSEALIINNVNGIVIEEDSELINQTVKLIENIEFRKLLGQNGRKFSMKFTPPEIKQQWLSLLKSLTIK